MSENSSRWMQLPARVHTRHTVVAAGSGRSCALYRLELTALQRLLEPASAGRAHRERAGCWFTIENGASGLVLVDPSRAWLRWPADRIRIRRGRDLNADQRCNALYQRLGRPRPAAVRMREWRLEPDDEVWVTGWLQRLASAGGESGGYRARPTQLVLRAVDLFKLSMNERAG